jgi:hypothetical protein
LDYSIFGRCRQGEVYFKLQGRVTYKQASFELLIGKNLRIQA